MAASFLQYCATCEKQIIVLNNSILYCSESCRIKDNSKLFAYPHLFSGSDGVSVSSASWITLAAGDPLKPPPEIIPQLAPTKPQQPKSPLSPKFQADPSTSPSSYRSVNGNGEHAEAKPYSAAAQSLKQLQNYTTTRAQPYRSNTTHRSTPTPTSPNMSSHGSLYRPALLRSNKSSSSTLPSLTTSSGTSSPASSPPISFPHHANPPSYTYTTERPLPLRSQASAYSASPRSIDLVTPHLPRPDLADTPRSVADNKTSGLGIDGGELLYEKNWTLPTVGRQSGSLKKLFNFDGMQGRPSSGFPSKGYSVGGYEMTRQGRALPQTPSVTSLGYRGGL